MEDTVPLLSGESEDDKNLSVNKQWDLAKNKSTEKNYMNQFRALFLKSLAIQRRSKATNCCQVLTPVFMLLLLFGIQAWIGPALATESDDISNPTIWPLFLTLPRPSDDYDILDVLPEKTSILTTGIQMPLYPRTFSVRLVDSDFPNSPNECFSDDYDDGGYTADIPFKTVMYKSSDDIDSVLYINGKLHGTILLDLKLLMLILILSHFLQLSMEIVL